MSEGRWPVGWPELVAPFPYFGGKRRAAPIIWRELGDPAGYVEPFAGSAAVLLARPAFKGRRVGRKLERRWARVSAGIEVAMWEADLSYSAATRVAEAMDRPYYPEAWK